MNDLRVAIVGFIAVFVGFAGAWMVFGGRASHLEEENRALRDRQLSPLAHAIDAPTDDPQRMLVGQWATTLSKSRRGRIELIFELKDDGSVRWLSVQQQKFEAIARGTWEFDRNQIRFTVTILDEASPEKDQEKTTTARIIELSATCLTLDVEGDEWAFHRTST